MRVKVVMCVCDVQERRCADADDAGKELEAFLSLQGARHRPGGGQS
jgi:hypothetical protein